MNWILYIHQSSDATDNRLKYRLISLIVQYLEKDVTDEEEEEEEEAPAEGAKKAGSHGEAKKDAHAKDAKAKGGHAPAKEEKKPAAAKKGH